MALDWTGSIIVGVTEANVSYIATGTDPDVHGHAEISGNASSDAGISPEANLHDKNLAYR